ncbi:cell division protein FtsQ/DivIB [Listeria ilorinensis]|uniref:cell division protein FtsQ/DivIB n=1 Tax=Listeria ilorinensis TaxID=2867439 RepID=UPI001EF52422|nr:cell division protein FtsQ/DivIB [Listeria ilorinensis]
MAENRKVVSIEKRIPELKKYRRKKLIRHLAILIGFFAILILITLYFISPYSKVDTIYVSGNRQLTEDEVRKASGIKQGEYVFAINSSNVSDQLEKNELIKKAKVEKSGINDYRITITENKTVGYEEKDGGYYDILENGVMLDNKKTSFPIGNEPLFVGFKNGQVLKDMVSQLNKLDEDIQGAISEIHLEPTDSDPEHIRLYMNDGNQVVASINSFADKMQYYPSIAAQLNEGQRGVIDMEVGSYFQSYYKQNEEKKQGKSE